ncbi:hypothetical protein Tco_1439909 [Tanacetum coccineum]
MKQEGLKRQKRNSSNDDKISEDLLKEGNKNNIDDLLKRIKTMSHEDKVVKALYGLHQALRACCNNTNGDKDAFTKDEERLLMLDVYLYRSMIGSLMYLTASRPDIMYAICVCSRFQVTPKISHLNAVKRIFSIRANQTWAYGILGNHPLTWKLSLIVTMEGPTLTGNLQQVVVNYLDKDLSHGNARTRQIVGHFKTKADMHSMDEREECQHTYEESSPVHHHFSPPQEQAPSQMPMDDLLHEVPKLISRIDSLEMDLKQTRLTMGNAIVKFVKKVKKMEGFLKRRNLVLTNSEEEEPEAQGRKNQDDPQDSLVQGLVTPSTTKVKASGEEQEEDISPNTLEAAKTLSKVASLKTRSIDKGRRYKRRKEAKGKKVVSSLDFQEEVDAGAEQVNTASAEQVSTAEGVNTGSIKLSTGKNSKKSKEQVLKRKLVLAEAIRWVMSKKDEIELQHYTNEEGNLIRAKIEVNAELKKYFAEERARAKRNKPMTQSQLKTYMMNYLKNQGTWKLSQLKSLSFEEIKKEFDKLVKQVESFAPISFEATKASLKRFGEELQTKTSKRLKEDEDVVAKDDESTKKFGKRRKQMARKGLHTSVDKDDSEDSDEVGEQEESVTGTKTLINPVPVAMKTPSIATYKIIKQGEKGVYQIVREDGTDIVYINFGAMMKSISRDDLTELYRIVMNRYGMNGPEDELERVFWNYLKNMFEEPLSTDPIWSEVGQQKIISWRYYESCRVHCLNLESMDVYMLIERTYPLSAEMCKAMLDKKLQGGKPDENCYKMLKMMEKQAVAERETEVTKNTVLPTNNESTKDVQPPVVPVETQNSEPVVAPVIAPKPNPKPSIPYPSRLNDQNLNEKADDQIKKFYEIFKDLSFKIIFTDALILMLKFASTLKIIGNKRKKLSEDEPRRL